MTGPKPKKFVKRYGQGVQRLTDLTEKFPERPSSEAIRDFRVAARRVQAMIRILPKGVRKSKRARKFKTSLGTILKTTSPIRDLDTLIGSLRIEKAFLPGDLLKSMENERSDLAAVARPPVMAFSKVKAPSLNPTQLGPKGLVRRMRRQIDAQIQSVSALLPEVTGDESMIKELHSLRKEVKKLRYVMELEDGDSPQIKTLTVWQEALGAVHDLDVAIEFLQDSRWKIPESTLVDLRRRRHSMYTRFLAIVFGSTKMLRESPIFSLSILDRSRR